MDRDGGFFTDGTRYIMLGIFLIFFIGMMMVIPRREDNHDTWLVEVYIVGKEIVEMDEEAVYLLYTEDSIGNEAVYEMTQKTLNERLKVENAYKEIKKGKYYRLRVAAAEDYGCHYPCVSGAATLIDGFPEETTQGK